MFVSEFNVNSIAEEKEDTLGWGANRSVGYCLPYAGAAAGAEKNEICSENRHPSDAIEPAVPENKSLNKERSDNIEPACELACESYSGGDERFRRWSDKGGRLGKILLLISKSKSPVDQSSIDRRI